MWARLAPATALRRAGLVVSVFLAIWSVKLWTIGRYGSDLPYWDQWAKEGELFYAPWFQHHEFWHNLFIPHNEHRIAPTLALNLGLVELGGDQWDARVQCVASAALHALLMAGLAWWALRRFSRRWAVASAGLLVLITAPPIAWENVLGGFQSQFYFLAIFSIVAIGLMLGSRAFSIGWFVGIACAALACVSMGSGMLVAAPIAVVAAMRLVRDPGDATPSSRRFDSLITLIAALVIGGIGWYYRPQAPWHASIHAHSLSESLLYAARCLSWPLYDAPWLAIVFWAPWAVLAGLCVRELSLSPTGADGAAPSWGARGATGFILAGGLWVLAQVAAVTYSRAGGSDLPAVRYGDICALGLAFNFFALAWLATSGRGVCGYDLSAEGWAKAERERVGDRGSYDHERVADRGGYERERVAPTEFGRASADPLAHARSHAKPGGRGAVTAHVLIAIAWLLAVASAITIATRVELRTDLPRKKSESETYEHNTQAFVLTDDLPALQRENGQLPFPDPDWLARIIRNPTLRALLPPSVREPVSVSGFANSPAPAPVLTDRATRTVTGPAEWRSAPISPGHGWWKIETAGAVRDPGASLTLVSAATGRVLVRIMPTKPPGDSWRAAYVRAPHEPAVIVAKVTTPGQWIAFSEPVEMSSLGHAVWRLTLNAWVVALIGFAGLVAFGWLVVRKPTER